MAQWKSYRPEQCYPFSFTLLQGQIWAGEELPWSVFRPVWPSPLWTSLNRSFAAPQESKSMGNVLQRPALSAKGWRRVVQRHERWHYNTEVQDSLCQLIGAWLKLNKKEKSKSRQVMRSGFNPRTCLLLDKGLQKYRTSCSFAFVSIIGQPFLKN